MPKIESELLRKLIHLSGPLLIIGGYMFFRFYFSEQIAIFALTVVLLVLLEVEYFRLEYKPRIPKVLQALLRPKEKGNVLSGIFLVIATIIVFAAFDFWIALLALLMTVFGDIFAAIIGIKYGTTKIVGKKTLEGFMAGLGANIIVGALVLPAYPLVFLGMALTASIVELLTNKLEDNITVPLFAAFVGHLIAYFTGVSLML